MLTSLAFIFLAGLAMAAICERIGLPRIIGMLVTGIVLGPYVLNLLDPSILGISSELRQMALIIILLKAGLSLNLADLKKVGCPAVMMAFVPASFEILAFFLFAPYVLGITRIEAAVMGAVLGAVSPAVVIPRMVQLMENSYGTQKSIPQMIMAGASCDDIFVIVLFTTFVRMAQGGSAKASDFVQIPISIGLGVVLGAAAGYVLARVFETAYARAHCVRNSMKVILVLGLSFLLMAVETWLKGIVSISGLLAVVSMACMLKAKCVPEVSKRLSEKFGKLWLAAEVVLFVLVGAAVDIRYTASAGANALLMIGIALLFRATGVFLCMAGTQLAVLCDRLSAESNRTGGGRVGSAESRSAVRTACALGCSAFDSRDRADWSDRDGQNVSEAVGAGRRRSWGELRHMIRARRVCPSSPRHSQKRIWDAIRCCAAAFTHKSSAPSVAFRRQIFMRA